MLPNRATDTPIGMRILIAWNGSREAARALHDARPFLREAQEVHLLTLGAHSGDAEADLRHRLGREGCRVERVGDPYVAEGAGVVLRRHVEKVAPDLVVMGLYGRPRLEEWALGGVSRNMLTDPPVPLLLSH